MALYLGSGKKRLFLNNLLSSFQYFTPRIPYEYQEVQYVEAPSGINAYIDLGFAFDTGAMVEIDYVESSTNRGRYIFGAAENSGALRCMITETAGTQGTIGYGSTGSSYCELSLQATGFLDNQFNFYRLTLQNGLAKFENASMGTYVSKDTQKTYTMTNNLYLFAQNYNGTVRFGSGYARIRTFKYYDKNENLICDLVPCYRKNDGEIGMYDIVRNIFLTNIGTGDFIRGDIANGGGNQEDEDNVETGYQQVEWIAAGKDVNAYIDLGFTFDTKAKIEMSQYISSDTNAYLFGAAENSGTLRCMLSAPYSSKLSLYGSNGSAYIGIQSVSYVTGLNEYEMIFESGNLKMTNKTNGGTNTLTTQKSYTMTNNLYLLGQNYNGTARFGGERKVGYFRYYDKDNVLICDLIPCFRKRDGAIGMYDRVRNIFLTSAGTNSFTKGASI